MSKHVFYTITDNNLSFHSPDLIERVSVLPREVKIIKEWVSFDCMQENKAIAVGKIQLKSIKFRTLSQ